MRVSKRGASHCQTTEALAQAEGEMQISQRAHTTLVLVQNLRISCSGKQTNKNTAKTTNQPTNSSNQTKKPHTQIPTFKKRFVDIQLSKKTTNAYEIGALKNNFSRFNRVCSQASIKIFASDDQASPQV